ncbi:RDD family protein [Paenibacillus lutrae]|uniref:RDD family protein n=1 Tax=Paenibacillus lutrae TaxID=2078573 RepID=A0A7X3FMC6_9BACL|nr:RDD family protein [Paenibacillus lutrae]MVP01907.1 RDD family protein [Paenibacillus lutrae]
MDLPAGSLKRIVAALLDATILAISASLVQGLTGFDLQNALNGYPAYIIMGLYQFLFPLFWEGYTPGKRMMGIQIVAMDGSPVKVKTMFIRAIIFQAILYSFTYGIFTIIGLAMILIRSDRRTLHDLAAGTYVRIPHSSLTFSDTPHHR